MTHFVSLLESHIQVATDEIRHLVGVFENQEDYFARRKPFKTYWLRNTTVEVGIDLLNMLTVLPSNAELGVDYFLDAEALTLPPSQPSPHHVFNYTTKQWEDPRTLADLKAAQWTQIKQARTQAEYAGFTWDGSVFDSDATSQQRINGAVSLALIAKQASQPYSITWTLADNTLRVLSADDMISVGLALGTHVQATFNKGQQLQQQIEAATTKGEIEVITW